MASYSNFLSSFANQTTITGTDILSKGQTINSPNGTVKVNGTSTTATTGHSSDGYLIIGNLLIQFSTTQPSSLSNLNNGNYYTFTFPINYGNNYSYNVTCIPVFNSSSSGNCEATTYTYPNISTYDPSANFNAYIGNSHNGNFLWIAIGPKPSTITFAPSITQTQPYLSSFLSNFSGGSRIDGSNCDIMSNTYIVGSLNSSLGHNIDGVMFLGKLLIQFSATTSPTDQSTGGGQIITFPITYSNSSNLLNILQSGTRQASSANWVGINITASTASNFTFNMFNATGNISWISIGIAPTTPIYTNIINSGSILYLNAVAMDSTGKYQYCCGGTTSGSGTINVNSNYGYGAWTTILSSSSYNFTGITTNSTGQYVYATNAGISGGGGLIFKSSNYGGSFTGLSGSPTTSWSCITCSSNGSFIAAASGTNIIYTSNNSGTTWISTIAPQNKLWYSIASDSTGQYLAACQYNGYVYVSSNYGSSWTQTSTPSGYWRSIASDSTGQYLAVVADSTGGNGYIYVSSNYGTTWTQTSAPNSNWRSIASNSTGQYLTASDYGIGIYYSNNYGSTWSITSAPGLNYSKLAVAMNSNGNVVTETAYLTSAGNPIYVSLNASN